MVVRLHLVLIMLVIMRTVVARVLVIVGMRLAPVGMFVRVLVSMGVRMFVCVLHPAM